MFVVIFVHLCINWVVCEELRKFPQDFLFGVASSAYQIEGGHDANGKGESIWDYAAHLNNSFIKDLSNGDVTCNSYHKFRNDVALIKDLGVDFYKFSLSWTRILPSGYANRINPDGIRYYNALIDELLSNGIEPMATLYHWDMPKSLQDLGGWTNPHLAGIFADYAQVAFSHFGDRVKFWFTLNSACLGYGDDLYPPFLNQSGIADYLCSHGVLLAHARTYHLYDRQYRPTQKGKIGFQIDARWYEPVSNSSEDEQAAERARQFNIGIFANAIYNPNGDYPDIVKERLGNHSKTEGFFKSRLPTFTTEEVDYIQGTYDFLGVNIYTSFLVGENERNTSQSLFDKDVGVRLFQDDTWPKSCSDWLTVVPWGVRKVLKWIQRNYDDPDIFIVENGFSDDGQLQDNDRIRFFQLYLDSILDSLHKDKVNVKGYAVWSLLDNFEWLSGYTEKFGIYSVNFTDPNRERRAKASVDWYKKLVKTKHLQELSESLS